MPFSTWSTCLYRHPPFPFQSLFHGGLDCKSPPHPPIPRARRYANFFEQVSDAVGGLTPGFHRTRYGRVNVAFTLGVQRITKLTVRIGSRFLSHGSDHFRINNNNGNKTNVTLYKIFNRVKTK